MKTRSSLMIGLVLTAFLWPTSSLYAAKSDGAKAKVVTKYDTNKNGRLDPEDYEAVRKDFTAAPNGVLARLDADKDGKLSDEEIAKLAGGAAKRGGKSDGAKAKVVAKYDANKNGKLDPEDYEAVRQDFTAAPTGILARLDADKDGKLSDEEIARLAGGAGKKAVKSDAERLEKKAKRAKKNV